MPDTRRPSVAPNPRDPARPTWGCSARTWRNDAERRAGTAGTRQDVAGGQW